MNPTFQPPSVRVGVLLVRVGGGGAAAAVLALAGGLSSLAAQPNLAEQALSARPLVLKPGERQLFLDDFLLADIARSCGASPIRR
jgi:hypothetical protein